MALKITIDNRVVNQDNNTAVMRITIQGERKQIRDEWADEVISALNLDSGRYVKVSFGLSWSSSLELFVELDPEQEVLLKLKHSELFGESQ